MNINLVIERIKDLRISNDPKLHEDIAFTMHATFSNGESAIVGLRTEVLREMMHALLDVKIPKALDKTIGRH